MKFTLHVNLNALSKRRWIYQKVCFWHPQQRVHIATVGTGFGLAVNKKLSSYSRGAALQNCSIRPTASTEPVRSVENSYHDEKRTVFIKIINRSSIVVLSK